MRYLNFLRDELTAIILNKYKIQSTFKMYEDPREWHVQKPVFYLQIMEPSQVPIYKTIFVAEFAWLKITRRA